MSDGCHANTSTFARRKATSALSYLGSRVALMVKVPPVPSSLADTFLVAGGAAIVLLHLPVELDGVSSTVAQHSKRCACRSGHQNSCRTWSSFSPRELQRQVSRDPLRLLLPGRSC